MSRFLFAMLTILFCFQSQLEAVDYYISVNVNNDRGAVIRSSDGINWTEVYSTGTNSFARLNGIWAANENDIWTVGGKGHIAHFDGTSWSNWSIDPTVELQSISGADSNNIWAVGSNQSIYKFNGSSWTKQGTNPSYTSTLVGVSMLNANQGWTTDTTGPLYQYNGSNWQIQSSNASNALNGISAISSTNVIAVGSSGAYSQYNGTVWQGQRFSNDADYYDVFALNANQIWAVGSKVWTSAPYGNEAAIMKYDGTGWTLQRSNVVTSLYAVTARNPNDVWAVGYAGKIVNYDGSTWIDKSPAFWNNGTGAFTGIVIVPEPSSLMTGVIALGLFSLCAVRAKSKQCSVKN